MAHDIFISYSTKDKAVADAVCARMESGGLRCWYAPRDIEPGADWAGSIVEAVNSSRVMVLIFTPHSNVSKQVLREVDCAVAAGVTLLPFRLTEEEPAESMRYYLSAVHWLDAVDEKLDTSIGELYQLCRAVVETSPAAVLPTGSRPRKRSSAKIWIPLAGAAAVLALLAVIFLPKLIKSDPTDPASDAPVIWAEAPVGEQSKGAGTEPDHYLTGNTCGNLQAGGFIAYSEGWYYVRSNDEEKLYKMRGDGSEAQKLSDHSARLITVYGDYVYFVEEHGYVGIYRVKTDGTEEVQLFGSEVLFMGIIGDTLYYLDSYDGLRARDLARDPDSTAWGGDPVYEDEEVIDSIYQMCFDGTYIYYTGFRFDGIRRVAVTGGQPETLLSDKAESPVLAGGYLYYRDLTAEKVKAYRLETGETVTAVPFGMEYFHIRRDGIYGQRKRDGILVRYDPSTGVTYELSDRQVAYVCLAEDMLFYWDFNKYYATDLTGKGGIKL